MNNWPAIDLYWAAQSQDRMTSDMASLVIKNRWPKREDFEKEIKPELEKNKEQCHT